MARKIAKEEFLKMFHSAHPDYQIELLEYIAISKPAKIKCLKCGKIHEKTVARNFINSFSCCIKEERKIDKVIKGYKKIEDFTFVKQVDKDNVIVRHEICGNEFKRALNSILNNFESCPYCNTKKLNNQLSLKQAQEQVNEKFDNIKILQYNGQEKKSQYRCLKCGMIFNQKQVCLLQSRGCPKCDRWQSNGEKMMKKILDDKNVSYIEQYSVEDLPLQRFDFCLFDKDGQILGFIEVNGEQHYQEKLIFRDGLKKIQERDQRKREYCLKNNIPLYEIKYFKGQFKNLEILPF